MDTDSTYSHKKFFIYAARAVFRHWMLLVTGFTITLLLGAIEHWKQQSISWKAYCSVILTPLFWSLCLSWRDEYKGKLQLAADYDLLKNPNLSASIQNAMVCSTPNGETAMTLALQVINRGAPSVVRMGKTSVTLRDGSVLRAQVLFQNIVDTRLGGAPGVLDIILKPADHIARKGMETPLQQGAGIDGWIMYTFPGVSRERICDPNTFVTCEIVDVNDKVLLATAQPFKLLP